MNRRTSGTLLLLFAAICFAATALVTGCKQSSSGGIGPDATVGDETDAAVNNTCEQVQFGTFTTASNIESTLVTDKEGLPDFCQVTGIIEDYVNFESRLPIDNWNHKFMMAGCGGFCGVLLPDKPGYSNSINEALKLGYAVTAHDGGHQAPSFDTSWAIGNRRALELWAGEVLPVVTKASEEIVSAFYGLAPSRKYFSGCSNGGRLGLIAAQRYPDLFDGIAAGGAIFDLSGTAGIYGPWLIRQMMKHDGSPTIDKQKLPLLVNHIMQLCDKSDGVRDGSIADPRACEVTLDELQCKNASNSQCFTTPELNHIRALYNGAMNSTGEKLFVGPSPGSEPYWDIWVVGEKSKPAWGALASQGYLNLANAVPAGDQYDVFTYDFDNDPARLRNLELATLTDAVDPDLSGLRAAGTKLLIWHGWSDPLVLPERTVQYYESVVKASGGQAVADENVRLFMIPGQGHCWEKPAGSPDLFNPVEVLDTWVEENVPPDSIELAQRGPHGGVARTRSVCAYPGKAQPIVAGSSSSRTDIACK